MTPVKSIQEVKSIREVKHITPIEEEVAAAAIKKFRLKNQLETGGYEAEDEEDEADDVIRRLQESEEEIEEELEKEEGAKELLAQEIAKEDAKLSALTKVKAQHEEHAYELESRKEKLEEMEDTIAAAGGSVQEDIL